MHGRERELYQEGREIAPPSSWAKPLRERVNQTTYKRSPHEEVHRRRDQPDGFRRFVDPPRPGSQEPAR